MRRLLALALLCPLAAACGGSGRLSADAYRATLARISKRAERAHSNVEAGLQAKSVAQLAKRLSAFAAADDRLGDDIAALKPPQDAAQANAALARAEHDTADAVRSILPQVKRAANTQSALALLQHDRRAAKAGHELESALAMLRKLGYTKGS